MTRWMEYLVLGIPFMLAGRIWEMLSPLRLYIIAAFMVGGYEERERRGRKKSECQQEAREARKKRKDKA